MQNKFAYQGKSPLWRGSVNLFASYETSQCNEWVQSRLVKISYLYDWICLLESGLFDLLFVSTAEIALPQIKFRAAKARITICKLFVVPARMCSPCTVSYLLCCCFSCRHVAKETISREVLQNESSNEVSRQSLRKCVRIFARTLRSAHFRSFRGPSARTP